MSGQKKQDNSEERHKVAIREEAESLAAGGAIVFEGFSGHGAMYRAVWHGHPGVTIDKDPLKASRAARQRPNWGCYQGDTLRALADGWFSAIPFSLVDLDPYGEPWPFVREYLTNHRIYPQEFVLICTDGYWPQRNMSSKSKTLLGCAGRMSGVSDSAYVEICREFVDMECAKNGLEVVTSKSERRVRGAKGVGQHLFTIRTARAVPSRSPSGIPE